MVDLPQRLAALADINVVHAKLVEAGEDWADKQAAAQLLEDTEKSVLAEIAVKCKLDGHGVGASELLARKSLEYRSHIESAVEARRLANRARVAYDGIKVWAELLRTCEASRRAEMRL